MSTAAGSSPARALLVITPWKRRWELGGGAGLADDFHFIHELTSRGWRVHYVCPRDAAPPDVMAGGYAVHHFFNIFEVTARWPVWLRRLLWPSFFSLFATWRSLLAARDLKPDIVLGQSHLSSLATFLVAIVRGVPSAVKLFGVETLNEPGASRVRHLRRNAEMIAALKLPHDLWIVLDDGTGGDAALRRHGVPSEKIRLLPNGVDLAWGSRSGDGNAFRNRLDIPEDAVVLLWLARLVDWKRPDAAVRAFARARRRSSLRMVLVIAGDGPLRPHLEELSSELNVRDEVRFAGPVPHARVPDAMAASTLFIATSERSNKSIATCEAMLCGVPVIAFDAGGTSDVVRDRETGRLVPDGDTGALADAIVETLAGTAACMAMGTAGRDFARARFTGWSRRIEMEHELFERLCASAAFRHGAE